MASLASDVLFSIDTNLQIKNGLNIETRNTNKTLTMKDSPYQAIDNTHGSAIDCTLPAPASGVAFHILSLSASQNIVVKDPGGSTVATLAPDKYCLVVSDGTGWYSMLVA